MEASNSTNYSQIVKNAKVTATELKLKTTLVDVDVTCLGSNFTVYTLENKSKVPNLEKGALLFLLEKHTSSFPTLSNENSMVEFRYDQFGPPQTAETIRENLRPLFTKTSTFVSPITHKENKPMVYEKLQILLNNLQQYKDLLMIPQSGGAKRKPRSKKKTVRKHKGIYQRGPKAGKLKPGYKYSGKKTKTGLKIIVKV